MKSVLKQKLQRVSQVKMGAGERFRGQGRDLGGREVNTRCQVPVLGQGWDVRNRKTFVCGGGGGGDYCAWEGGERLETRSVEVTPGQRAVVRTLAFALGEKRTWEGLSILAACGESGWQLRRHGRGCFLHNDCSWPVSPALPSTHQLKPYPEG